VRANATGDPTPAAVAAQRGGLPSDSGSEFKSAAEVKFGDAGQAKKLISVKGEVWQRVKAEARERGVSVTTAVEQALGLWLEAGQVKRTICPDVRPVVRETIRTDALSL
jgi:hypothetical protein